MATAPRLGLNPCKSVGSGADNKGLTEYTLANAYATALGVGDLVKLTTDGTVIQGTNAIDQLGVFHGVKYVDSTGRIQIQKYWPASTTSLETPVTVLVMDNPVSTYLAVTSGPTTAIIPGQIFALNLTAPNAATGRSTMTINNTVVKTGATDITGATDMGATVTNIDDSDAFNISTSVHTTPVTITIGATETTAHFLAQLNAVPGISATTNGSGFLVVTVTDGGSLILADGAGTPLADSTILAVTGTYTPYVAAGSGAVRVLKVIDSVNQVVEVMLDEPLFRAHGG